MISSLGSINTICKYSGSSAPPTVTGKLYDFIFSSANLSGNNVKNQVDNSYSGVYAGTASSDVASDSPYQALSLKYNFTLSSGVTYNSSKGITITFRQKMVTSRANTDSILGGASTGVVCGNSNFFLSLQKSNPWNTWIWLNNNGNSTYQSNIPGYDTGVTPSGGYLTMPSTASWMYIFVIIGWNHGTQTLGSNYLTYGFDFKPSDSSFSSANLSTQYKTFNNANFTNGSPLTLNNYFFFPYSAGVSDNKIANVRVYDHALTLTELVTDYSL